MAFFFDASRRKSVSGKLLIPFFLCELIDVTKVRSRQYGGVVRVLDLYSGGPRFKPSKLLLSGFILGFPEFNSLGVLCIQPTGLPVGNWDF